MAFSQDLPHSFEEALKVAERILEQSHSIRGKGTARAEAEQLVDAAFRHAMGKSLTRMELYARMKDRFPEEAGEKLLVFAHSRAQGKLLQHLTGYQAFLDHEYEVSASTLVPRPETEILALTAIDELMRWPQERSREPSRGIEIGLGSGVLSIELLSRFKGLTMIATEINQEAIALALRNAEKIKVSDRLSTVAVQDPLQVLEPFRSLPPFDFIISNPPYLEKDSEADEEVRANEPRAALFGPTGNVDHFYEQVAAHGSKCMRADGLAFLEIPHERADKIAERFRSRGWEVRLVLDLTSRPRVLVGKLKSSAE